MGLQQTIHTNRILAWDHFQSICRDRGTVLLLRMIDGLPAFPNEIPEPTWNELRVSLDGNMVTIRRVESGYSVIVWGNAEELVRSLQQQIVAVITELTSGHVEPVDRSGER